MFFRALLLNWECLTHIEMPLTPLLVKNLFEYYTIVLSPLDPRFSGSIPTEGDGFLRVIKIRSTTSFGGEVKPSVPCRRFTACKRTLRA
jgi:hypothetical protein